MKAKKPKGMKNDKVMPAKDNMKPNKFNPKQLKFKANARGK